MKGNEQRIEFEGMAPSADKQYDVNNRDICLYALALRGGGSRIISTEDVAVKAFELYPERFAMIGYPQYPSADSVRVTLTDLRKVQYGVLVKGDHKNGWIITDAGKNWLDLNESKVVSAIHKKHPKEKRVASGKLITNKKLRDVYKRRILESQAFRKWSEGKEPSKYEFFDVMRVDEYTPEDEYRKSLSNMLLAIDSELELTKFLKHLDRLYGSNYRKHG